MATAPPGFDSSEAKRALAGQLRYLGDMLTSLGRASPAGRVEGVACLREALALSEATPDVGLKQRLLINLINAAGDEPDKNMEPADAAALVSRLNQLQIQTGRTPDKECVICQDDLVPQLQVGGGVEKDATGDGGHPGGAGSAKEAVRVLWCGHQFHFGCFSEWRRTAKTDACPTCRKGTPRLADAC